MSLSSLFISTAYAAEEGISVKLAPYILGEVAGFPITSTMFTTWLVMLGLVVFAFFVGRRVKLIPSWVQSLTELVIGGVYDYVVEVLENRQLAKRYFPIIMTIFIFVLAINWAGLLPGVTAFGIYDGDGHLTPLLYPAATDLNITLAFALVAFLTVEVAGVLAIGFFRYAGKFLNFKSPLAFVIGLIEFISELARLISFSFRLFGNIFAGKTLIVVAMFFVPFLLPIPLLAFEVFVGFIQAFIFAVLTLFFIKLAVAEPH